MVARAVGLSYPLWVMDASFEASRQSILSKTLFRIGKRCREFLDSLQAPEAAGMRGTGVHLMGCSRLRPPYIMSRPHSRFDLLLLPVEGELRLTLPDRVTTIRAGDAWIIPARSFSRFELTVAHSSMSWFHFDPGCIPARLHSGNATRIAQKSSVNARLLSYLDSLREEGGHAESRSRQIRHGLYELVRLELERLLFSGANEASRESKEQLDQVWKEVERDTSRSWDVPALARLANLSPSRFHTVSLRQFGMTPHDKLNQIRMNHAIAMLLATEEKIETIARATAFSTAFAFSKAFKKAVGSSPTHFRQSRTGNT